MADYPHISFLSGMKVLFWYGTIKKNALGLGSLFVYGTSFPHSQLVENRRFWRCEELSVDGEVSKGRAPGMSDATGAQARDITTTELSASLVHCLTHALARWSWTHAASTGILPTALYTVCVSKSQQGSNDRQFLVVRVLRSQQSWAPAPRHRSAFQHPQVVPSTQEPLPSCSFSFAVLLPLGIS